MGVIGGSMEAKDGVREMRSEDVDFHVCDGTDCNNSYTPFLATNGDRFCLTCGTK